jgi:hypothetical protein
MHIRLDQFHVTGGNRTEIDFYRLPGSGSILDWHLNPNRVCLLHVSCLSLEPECELIEA